MQCQDTKKRILLTIITLVMLGVASIAASTLGPDNPLEQLCEAIIEHIIFDWTGKKIDIDVSSEDNTASKIIDSAINKDSGVAAEQQPEVKIPDDNK